jgi:hypothetical protein
MSQTKAVSFDTCKVIYQKGSAGIIALVDPNDETKTLTLHKDVADVLENYEGAAIYENVDAIMPMIEEAENKKYITSFTEITKDQWWEMFECLPPYRTAHSDDGLCFAFLMSEYWTSNITGHYFRVQDRYFTARRRDTENIGDMYQEIMKQFFIKKQDQL